MAEELPKFVRRDGESIVFNQDGEFIFYILDEFFDNGCAIIEGEFVNIIGVLDYAIFDKNGKNGGLKRFYFPTSFLTKPYQIDKLKDVRLTKYIEPRDYRLLRYRKDDKIVVSTKVPEENGNLEEFFKVFLYGKLPTTIPYDKLHEYFNRNAKLNGADYNISMQIFGMLISQTCRDPKDLNKEFRLTNFKDYTGYKPISIIDVPKYISAYQSLVSQNWDNALVGSIMHDTDVDSPLEKLVMGQ